MEVTFNGGDFGDVAGSATTSLPRIVSFENGFTQLFGGDTNLLRSDDDNSVYLHLNQYTGGKQEKRGSCLGGKIGEQCFTQWFERGDGDRWKRLQGGDGGGGGVWRGKLGPLVAKSGKDLDRDGECGFDYLTIALVSSKASAKGVGLRGEDPIRARTGNLRAREGKWLLGTSSILKMMMTLIFLPKEPSPGFGISLPSASGNTEPSKDVEEPKVQPVEVTADSGECSKADVFVVHPGSVAARVKERKCKTRGSSLRPPIKSKLASGPSSSCAMRATTFASQDDASFLSISDNDEGLSDCFRLNDANACHLKISAITLPAWKGHLDNQIDLELLDLHDRCYTWQVVVDNAVNRRAREFLQNPVILALRENISSLTADVTEHKEADKARLEAVEVSLHREVEELKQDRRDVVSKVVPYADIELVHSDELGRLVGKLVSSTITYRRCRAYEQVAVIKEPFELSKPKGYRSSY
nr:probable xyloglucan endotransglucosylase/hydrolase protein 30 [Tanacetum cinerariifolium]